MGVAGPYIDNVLVSNASLRNGVNDYFSDAVLAPAAFVQPVAPATVAGITATTTNYWTNMDTI